MKREIATCACSLAMLISTSIPTPAGFKGARLSNLKMSTPLHSDPTPVLPLPQPTHLLAEDAVLTSLVRRITATPDFSGAVIPGQLLKVTLNLPPELAGATLRSRPRVVPPRRPVRRGATPRRTPLRSETPRSIPARPVESLSHARRRSDDRTTPAVADKVAAFDKIPCEHLPGGCPPLSTLPPDPTAAPAATQLPFSNIMLDVKWSIFEFDRATRGAALVKDRDFQLPTPQGLSQPFVLAPLKIEEYTSKVLPPSPYLIVATVSATADKIVALPPSTTRVTSAEVPLEVRLALFPLEVPEVFVLFHHKNLGGALAIYLPKNTIFQGESDVVKKQLFDGATKLLNTYNTVASRLEFVAWFASYLTGLRELRKVVNLPRASVKERKDKESNLNNDDFIDRGKITIKFNDIEVNDESSSLLLLATPGTKVQFFQDDSFKGGQFDVQTSNPNGDKIKPPLDYAPGVLVKDFNVLTPPSEPSGKVTLVKKFTIIPRGLFTPPTIREVTPNDRLSSFKWVL